VLWVNRRAAGVIRRRVSPIVIGLAPGIAIGTIVVARVNPGWLRFATFVVLLPLILMQAAGIRRPIRAERAAGLVFGSGVGVLYAVTTISGPPLALMLSNQGFVLSEFRAALGLVRLAESGLTAIAYSAAGLFTSESLRIAAAVVPSVAIGVPIGAWLIKRVDAETFRRICMSFDAWIVAFGISALLRELHIVDSGYAFLVMVAVILFDAWLLYRFFSVRAWSARL